MEQTINERRKLARVQAISCLCWGTGMVAEPTVLECSGTMKPVFRSQLAIYDAGERIYRQMYQQRLESEHWGEFAAINVTTSKAYVGATAEAALAGARAKDKNGKFHVVMIGNKRVPLD